MSQSRLNHFTKLFQDIKDKTHLHQESSLLRLRNLRKAQLRLLCHLLEPVETLFSVMMKMFLSSLIKIVLESILFVKAIVAKR